MSKKIDNLFEYDPRAVDGDANTDNNIPKSYIEEMYQLVTEILQHACA